MTIQLPGLPPITVEEDSNGRFVAGASYLRRSHPLIGAAWHMPTSKPHATREAAVGEVVQQIRGRA